MIEFEIRPLEVIHFAEANQMLMQAFGNATDRLADHQLYHRLQPDGWFAAFVGERLVGTVGAVRYSTFAHVGFMAVHPDFQHHGLGHHLMEFILADLRKHEVPMVTLDASKSGHPLYLKLDFEEHGWVHTYQAQHTGLALPVGAPVQKVTENDLPELASFDAPIFADGRRKVFEALLALHPGRGFLARDAAGRLTGYLFAVQNRIGPWVVADPAAARPLLAAALSLDYQANPLVVVPQECQAASDLLLKNGFTQIRSGRHMALNGRHPSARRDLMFAQTSMGAG